VRLPSLVRGGKIGALPSDWQAKSHSFAVAAGLFSADSQLIVGSVVAFDDDLGDVIIVVV
jgi:hypothetical protein